MAPTRKSKSYSKENKIEVVQWYHENGQNVSRTADHLSIGRKQVRNWIKDEGSILQMKGRSKAKRYRKEKHPLMEKKLHEEFLENRAKGNSVKRWWFTYRGRAILDELYPGEEFAFSDHWFRRFSTREGIAAKENTQESKRPCGSKAIDYSVSCQTLA